MARAGMASIPPLQPSSKLQSAESFLDALAGPLLDRCRLGRPALGFAYYDSESLDPRWRQALAEWARTRGLFTEHLLLVDLGGSPTRRILARQRVGEHLFSIEVRPAELPDTALQQPTPVADLNIHRDTFRDERLCLLIWVPRERARRFLELASNLVDYRTVDLDVPPFPEETPPVKQERRRARARHNLPMATLGRQFIGREEEIARVQAMLLTTGSGAITDALALEGLGGIGKTRLAVEYAWEHLADYDWVFFLRADTPETLRAGLARLADHEWLGLPEAGETEEERRVRAVLRWFEGHGRWLLILDNVDSEQIAGYIASEILPSLHRGHVLLTTRFRRWGGQVRALALAPLSESEAIRLLVATTEGQRRSLPDDPESAAALARALDGLPLALEQIAAWVRAKHCSFADALAAVTAEDAPALAWYDPRELRYPLPVAAVWERALESLGTAEHFLLRFLAWLAPAPAPDFLVQALNVIWQDQEGTPPDFVGLARGLCERSLLTARSDRAFLLHRLSLELERRRTPRPERFLWNSRVAEVLSTVVPKDTVDVRTWPRLALLQPHALDLFTRTEPLVPTTAFPAGDTRFAAHLSTLLNQFGIFLYAKAEFSIAELLLRRALAIAEQSFGPEHPKVAIRLNNLAQLLQATNRRKDAEPLMRRALAIDEQSYGPAHPEVATDLNNLAQLLQATHRLEEAEPLMRRALAIDENSYGPEHPEVATDLTNQSLI
jgi:tetratricopeptide (TPR) repeat protein